MSEIQGICEKKDEACEEKQGEDGEHPEVEHLEGAEDRHCGDSSLKPEEKWRKCKKEKSWSIEETNSRYYGDGNEIFEIMSRD